MLAYDELEQEQLRQDDATLLRKIVFRLLCEPLATSKPCAATIAARLTPEALMKATLFFTDSNLPRIQTS